MLKKSLTPEEKTKALSELMGISTENYDPIEEGKSIFLYGRSGSGKTAMAATGRKPCFYYEFDNDGEITLSGLKQVEFKSFVDDNPRKPDAYDRWLEHFELALETDFFERFSKGTVVFDGTNSFEMLIHSQLRNNRGSLGSMNAKTAATTQPEYNIITINTWDAINRVLGLRKMYGCDIIVCTHETYQKDEQTGKIMTLPLMYGQSDRKVFGIFSEAYRLIGKRRNNVLKIRACTKLDASFEAKSRLDNTGMALNFEEEPNLTMIFDKIKRSRKNG